MKPTGVASALRPCPSLPVKRHQSGARGTGQWPVASGNNFSLIGKGRGEARSNGGSRAAAAQRSATGGAGTRLRIQSNGCGRVAPGGPRRTGARAWLPRRRAAGAHQTLPARRLVQSGVPRGRPRLAGGWSRTLWGAGRPVRRWEVGSDAARGSWLVSGRPIGSRWSLLSRGGPRR